ncbi:MAG: DNA polymerase III subunit alpha [Chloroherpetonaceae bacterium]|nr:DNA polymerase III subunit alpha [Chloroherpetonaceae bacterium]
MTPNFIHLHTHTHYSMLSSPILPAELFQKCLDLGMNAVAVTDHASLFNMPELFSEAKKVSEKCGQPFKLIVGAELFIAPTSRHDKSTTEVHHLNVLVKNRIGYKNLCKILSIAAREGFYYRPRADRETLFTHAEGLICTTSCDRGELAKLVLRGDEAGAEAFIKAHKEVFGDDFYIELERHNAPEDARLNAHLIRLATKWDVKLVATNDVHYLEKKDAPIQEVMLAMKSKATLSSSKRMKFPTDEFYLKSPEEMAALFDNSHNELSHTLEIAEKCEFHFKDSNPQLPLFKLPEGFKDDADYLRYLTYQGAARKYGDLDALGERGKQIRERIEYELTTIAKMGFSSYFLIVSDLIAASRRQGYSVGPGRGSVAGSIVAYLTDITRVEPLQYDLLFERFLNPERISMPDIDIDFTPVGKQKVLEYTIDRYGEQSVAKVVAISTLGAKAVIKDVGRVLEIPLEEVTRITKLVPSKPIGAALRDFVYGKRDKHGNLEIEPVKELQDLLKSPDVRIRKLMEYSLALEGRARNVSVHAAGVVITNGCVDDYVPLYISDKVEAEERRYADEEPEEIELSSTGFKSKDEKQVVTQFDKDWIEKAGLLKIDYLGLETLAVIDEALRLIEKRHKVTIDLESLPMDDMKTYKIFQDGKMAGIFQFESPGMQSYMMQLRPTCIDDIIAMNALYRPGPMDLIPRYIERKHGREAIEYPHPLLEPILKSTYGIPVYQEQVMQMAQVMAGYTLGGADILRRAMGKKEKDKMAQEREKFVKGAAERGISEAKANEVFDMMEKFAGYGFNKSHAAAYGILAYWTAYLKAHYTAEFMCAVLNSEAGDAERMKLLTDEVRSMGIKILPPSLNKSDALSTVEDLPNGRTAIRIGFSAIKHVGSAAKEIVAARKRRRKSFKNLFDFCASVDLRVVNRKAIECLIEAGAMDEFGVGRATLLQNLERAIEFGQKQNRRTTLGQEGFFNDEQFLGSEEAAYPELVKAEEWSDSERLRREVALIGFYVSTHPLDAYRRDWEAFATLKLGSKTFEPKRLYRIIGVLTELKKHLDKKGNPMLFGTIEDFEGKADLTAFASVYERFEKDFQKDAVVMLIAEAERKDNQTKLLVQEVIPIRKVRDKFLQRVVLRLDADDAESLAKAQAVKEICDMHRGSVPIDFEVCYSENGKAARMRLFARRATVDPDNEVLEKLEHALGAGAVWLSS